MKKPIRRLTGDGLAIREVTTSHEGVVASLLPEAPRARRGASTSYRTESRNACRRCSVLDRYSGANATSSESCDVAT